jgi:anti-sigma B factor antagonist
MMVDTFRVSRGERDGFVVLVLGGDLDLLSRDRFEAAVEALRPLPAPLLVDLSGVDFVDSTGLNGLFTARAVALEETGSTLHLLAPTRPVRRLLELTASTDLFVVLD